MKKKCGACQRKHKGKHCTRCGSLTICKCKNEKIKWNIPTDGRFEKWVKSEALGLAMSHPIFLGEMIRRLSITGFVLNKSVQPHKDVKFYESAQKKIRKILMEINGPSIGQSEKYYEVYNFERFKKSVKLLNQYVETLENNYKSPN